MAWVGMRSASCNSSAVRKSKQHEQHTFFDAFGARIRLLLPSSRRRPQPCAGNTPENEARCESCTHRPYRGFAGTIARTITFRERRARRKHHACTASPLDLSVIVPPSPSWGPGQVVAGGLPVPSQEQRGVYLPIPDSLSNDPASCMPASVGAEGS